ncbi:armadillo-like helical domain-containing protein 4 isoform X1 [Fukomys damarensis]|uniref:armadillo-like helical domain-containing protein 4 isoform X1 n=1 Tax=Fukomys damarensis TaxID=885580 RepID=UPI00053F4773|nr:armadillo-like helical domain-containing protein 4 isoform X1 [Fukomys damarensis]
MSRSIVLHLCLAFGSFLFLQFATRCLAFPKREQEQSERISTDDLESSLVTPKLTPQLVSSEDARTASAEPAAVSLNEILWSNKETHPTRAGLLWFSSAGLYIASEPAVLTAASLSTDGEEEAWSNTNSQLAVEGTTETTQGFLTHVDNQLFANESQEGVSLGHTPSFYMNTGEMLTASPRTEKLEAATDQRTPSFPGAESTADAVPGNLLPKGENPSQMTADDTQATATKHLLVATSAYTLSFEPETDGFLGAPEITVSISSAVPATSVLGDEWDDTKLERGSRTRTASVGDNPEAAEVALGLPEGDTHVGTALQMSQRDEVSPASTHVSSFAPTSLPEGTEVSMSLFQGTGGVTDSTKGDSAVFLSEVTESGSESESEAYRPLGHVLKDITTQEMTTTAPEAEATLPFVTREQIAVLEDPRDRGDTEVGEESPSPGSDAPAATQLSRRWEPLATTVSTTVAPLSSGVTPAAQGFTDTVALPREEFTAVLGSLVTPSGATVEVTSSSPALPASEASSERTVPSGSSANTAAPYGLEQLESEEEEDDEDEEDEEDEDEEEEEEEDKDADSLDESFDGDSDLPGFTLPGVTSQEPGLEQGNGDPLAGATYQMPDAIEWEQQNQGLVRSWMEKLKDKAGYMSGMLVPVGVGIAGALFILGALYSIKVMNRRRRNGFKRHKRKREFNSMQDRVMLLADSSEDEF